VWPEIGKVIDTKLARSEAMMRTKFEDSLKCASISHTSYAITLNSTSDDVLFAA
jgi:hypothetical protein